MQCDGMISSKNTFSLPKNPTFFPLHPSSSSNRVSFINHSPNPTRFGFLKVRATINDGFVKPTSEMSFYELLGISQSVTLPDIKQAYKSLARKLHPDVSPPGRVEENTERFIRVQEAYEVLSDPRKRAMYDRDMARGLHLAFSAHKRMNQFDEEMEDKSDWRAHWQGQLSELKKRRSYKEARGENMSWGARMRVQRNESTES